LPHAGIRRRTGGSAAAFDAPGGVWLQAPAFGAALADRVLHFAVLTRLVLRHVESVPGCVEFRRVDFTSVIGP
jgi:hypothetical protein